MPNNKPSSDNPATNLSQQRREYERALLARSTERATRAINSALEQGAHPLHIYEQIITPTHVAIGELWHEGEITISEEHIATQLSIDQLNRLRQLIVPKPPLNKRALIGALSGEAHWLGARIVADHFFYDGWTVDFLGPIPPLNDLLEYIGKTSPDLLLLSVTLDEDLKNAAKIAEKLKHLKQRPELIVGGRAFSEENEASALVKGISQASSPHEATILGRKLCGVLPAEAGLDQLLRSIGAKLQARRKERGLSQKYVAAAAGLDRTYLSSIESGKQNISLGVLARLANELELELSELMLIDERS